MIINYYYHNNNYDNDKDNNDYSIDNWNQITSITMIACWPSQPTRGSTLTAILDLRSCFKFLLIITICTSSPKCPFIAKWPKWRWAQVVGKFGAFSGEGLAARKHFGECAWTAGEGEEGLVGKIELFEMAWYNFEWLEINWAVHIRHWARIAGTRAKIQCPAIKRWNSLALCGNILRYFDN